jgi:hypothetical protein
MAIMALIIMSNQSKFGGQVLLQNFAYDVALSLRQAQVYGISVQRFTSNRYNAGYGIDFRSTTSYSLFADASPAIPDGIYSPATDDLKATNVITRGYTISKLCVPADLSDPSDPTSCNAVSIIDAVFVRPEPDALITWREAVTNIWHRCLPSRSAANCGASARIVLQSPRGDHMSVVVYSNGQIAVDQSIKNN